MGGRLGYPASPYGRAACLAQNSRKKALAFLAAIRERKDGLQAEQKDEDKKGFGPILALVALVAVAILALDGPAPQPHGLKYLRLPARQVKACCVWSGPNPKEPHDGPA